MSTARVPRLLGLALLLCLVTLLCTPALPQATISTGAIAGTVTDATGAVVMGAKVTILSKATGGQLTLQTTGTGAFNSGAVIPGEYSIRITQAGFKSVDVPVTVQVGSVVSVDVKLQVGATEEVMEVTSAAVTVNTEQATVQGVLTTTQIDSLPINGRNFLDLAQLEPGVQIQDGLNFDPTKGGFTGISVGGRAGRTTRIEMDGQDISDETVGTTVSNVSPSAIQEFSIQQSSLDMSTELTSSGAVNVVSRSGSNEYHGEAWYLFRGNQLAANFPGGVDLPYQRNHFGGRFGGPLVKDKLFFFLNAERVKQDLASPVNFSDPFKSLSGADPTPFRETMGTARLDWQIKPSARLFYRLNYDNNKGVTNFGYGWSNFGTTNNAPAHVLGVDFNSGLWTHSIRASYLKFLNRINTAPAPHVDVPGMTIRVDNYWSGPNVNAPQETIQSNKQLKYDGSRILGSHNFRYGFGFNQIHGGGFASFYGLGPYVRANAAKLVGALPGGAANPLNYSIRYIRFANGLGYATEMQMFGEPAGGQYDNRFQFYFGDSWKLKQNLTFTYGVRYVRDTGRTNSDVNPIPCSAISQTLINDAIAGGQPISTCPAGGNIGDMWGKGLGNRVRQDNNNFGPTLGFAWDMFKNGKTVIRGGAGLYYENAIFNNVLFSRSAYLPTGMFWNYQSVCGNTNFNFPMTGQVDLSLAPYNLNCAGAIGDQLTTIQSIFTQYQAESLAAGASSNPGFIGNTLSPYFSGANPLAPNYRTPYSIQMNLGVQHQFAEGVVLTADYVRNVNLHYMLSLDPNHVGDTRYLNVAAAQAAIAETNLDFGCAAADINCAIGAGATMEDYAGFGLGSGIDIGGGAPWYEAGMSQPYAFGGINPDVGANSMLFPSGRSVYHALQTSIRINKARPFRFLKNLNLQAAYTLSRFKSMAFDQDFIYSPWDNANPGRFFGPTAFDRTHQMSFGAVFEFPKFFKMSLTHHLNSPFPTSLSVANQARAGEIFYTDFTGDGTGGDLLPGTNIGSYGRSIGTGSLGSVIDHYNATTAGTLTPAGQALVNAGLMTEAQLIALGAVADTLPPVVSGYAHNGWLNNTDMRLSFPFKVGERFTIEPMVSFYNLFNVANFTVSPSCDNTGGTLCGALDGSGGQVGYTTKAGMNYNRGFQSPSLFNLGSARQMEFELRITF